MSDIERDRGKIDLKTAVAETIIINPAHLQARRQASQALCDAIGATNVRFCEGTSGLPHQLACALAHRKAMMSVTDLPALILEDDLELTGPPALPPLPADADIIYLSVTPFGCLPWSYGHLAIARHRAIQGLTLASVHDANWLRLHSMSGGQAILYVTQKGLDAWTQATFHTKRFGGPFDVFTAYAMKDVTVYAPHQPVFSERADVQRDSLRQNPAQLAKRLSFTRTPLRPFAAGDQTTVQFKGQVITVAAVAGQSGSLHWQVLGVEKAGGG